MIDRSKHRFLRDEAGNRTHAIVPIADFEAMLEDAEDVRLYDAAKVEDDGSRISLAEVKKYLGAK